MWCHWWLGTKQTEKAIEVNTISLLVLLILKQNQYKTAMKDHGLQWHMSLLINSWPIILLRAFLCNLWWFFSKYQLFDSSKVMNSSVNSLESANSLARVPSRHTNRGPIKPEWISRSYETAQKFLSLSLSNRNMYFPPYCTKRAILCGCSCVKYTVIWQYYFI